MWTEWSDHMATGSPVHYDCQLEVMEIKVVLESGASGASGGQLEEMVLVISTVGGPSRLSK